MVPNPWSRKYCPQCHQHKLQFDTKDKADLFIFYNSDEIKEKKGYAPVRAYYCKSCCCWHTTSKEKLEHITPSPRIDELDGAVTFLPGCNHAVIRGDAVAAIDEAAENCQQAVSQFMREENLSYKGKAKPRTTMNEKCKSTNTTNGEAINTFIEMLKNRQLKVAFEEGLYKYGVYGKSMYPDKTMKWIVRQYYRSVAPLHWVVNAFDWNCKTDGFTDAEEWASFNYAWMERALSKGYVAQEQTMRQELPNHVKGMIDLSKIPRPEKTKKSKAEKLTEKARRKQASEQVAKLMKEERKLEQHPAQEISEEQMVKNLRKAREELRQFHNIHIGVESSRHTAMLDEIRKWKNKYPMYAIKAELMEAAEMQIDDDARLAIMAVKNPDLDCRSQALADVQKTIDEGVSLIRSQMKQYADIEDEKVRKAEEERKAQEAEDAKRQAEEAERKRLEGIERQKRQAEAIKKAKDSQPVISDCDEDLVFEEEFDPDAVNVDDAALINVAVGIDAEGNETGTITLSNYLADVLSKLGYETANIAQMADGSVALAFSKAFKTPVCTNGKSHRVVESSKFAKALLKGMGDGKAERKNYKYEARRNKAKDFIFLKLKR